MNHEYELARALLRNTVSLAAGSAAGAIIGMSHRRLNRRISALGNLTRLGIVVGILDLVQYSASRSLQYAIEEDLGFFTGFMATYYGINSNGRPDPTLNPYYEMLDNLRHGKIEMWDYLVDPAKDSIIPSNDVIDALKTCLEKQIPYMEQRMSTGQKYETSAINDELEDARHAMEIIKARKRPLKFRGKTLE